MGHHSQDYTLALCRPRTQRLPLAVYAATQGGRDGVHAASGIAGAFARTRGITTARTWVRAWLAGLRP